jgi:mannose-1-phosphate guanylyltransferase
VDYALILSGGSGTRLWPLSRISHPKHLISLAGAEPLLSQTLHRLDGLIPPERRFLITVPEQAPLVRDMARDRAVGIIIEPVGRNNLLPMALATKMIYDRDKDANIIFLPCDHHINHPDKLRQALKSALKAAGAGYLATLGIPTAHPEPHYGHVKKSFEITKLRTGEMKAYQVEKFHEKPPQEIAERYTGDESWFWNGGIFIFSAATMLYHIEIHQPQLYEIITEVDQDLRKPNPALKKPVIDWTGYDLILNAYTNLPENLKTSIDYAIMEKADKVATIPVEMGWSDLGGFGSLSRLLEKDEQDNRIAHLAGEAEERVIFHGSKNVTAFPSRRAIVMLDCEDLIVVDTHDAILVLPRSSSRKVGEIVKELKSRGWNDLL